MLASTKLRRAVVIGAGPMGLETALHLIDRGFETIVLEAGRVGDHIRQWGHIRMFSPLAMNLSNRAKEIIGDKLPRGETIQTGNEFVQTALEPLAQSEILRDKIVTGRRVLAIARTGLGKTGLPNHPLRAERGFRILAQDREGREHLYHANYVFDASGVFGQGNWSGAAGMPALGERAINDRIIRHPPNLMQQAERFTGKRILVLGNGHSAANTIVAFHELLQREAATQVVWAVRSDRTKPVPEVPDDPLAERAAIVDAANALAARPPANLKILRRVTVEEFQRAGNAESASLKVALKVWKSVEIIEVDEVISLTGYRPNLEMLRETTVEVSNITEGSRGLYKALSNITDCLAKIEINPKDLQSGEPNLFIVGVKSYGRNPGFLLQSGLDQLESVFSTI